VWIKYGQQAASAPTVDSDYEPCFELDHSTNTSWLFEEFMEDDGLRPGSWATQVIMRSPDFYGGNQYTTVDPWVEAGVRVYESGGLRTRGRIYLYNPCEMTRANFGVSTNGEKYATDKANWNALIEDSPDGVTYSTKASIAAPAADSNWETWTEDVNPLTSGTKYVAIYNSNQDSTSDNRIEAADCTITLDSSNTPTTDIGTEQGSSYTLACTITNNTTGDAIALAYTTELNNELEIDTDAKTVTDLDDDSNQFQALTITGGARKDWLKLQSGANTLQYDETGVVAATVTVTYYERYY
jgi:hypothetical protein